MQEEKLVYYHKITILNDLLACLFMASISLTKLYSGQQFSLNARADVPITQNGILVLITEPGFNPAGKISSLLR
jgi:hypothetical protein